LEIGWAGIAAPDSRRSIVSEGSRRPRTRFTRRVVLNGHPEYRLPNTLNVAFPNHVSADILARLDGVAASTGSACHSGRVELSPVLTAMGIRPEIGMGAIRFSLGRYTAIEEIDAVVDRLTDVLAAGPRLNAKPPGLVEGTDRRSL
jgi:cysteine desulfurase